MSDNRRPGATLPQARGATGEGGSQVGQGGMRVGQLLPLGVVAAVAAPAVALRLTGLAAPAPLAAVTFGAGVIAAAFFLAWAVELLQLDVPQGAAIALLGLLAVLPEYSVDLVLAWKAGLDPDRYAPLALANMTGANRILIGFGWPLVVLLVAWSSRRRGKPISEIALPRTSTIEVAFLGAATLYTLTLPLRGTLTLFDTAVLVTIFALYVRRIVQTPAERPDLIGPSQALARLSVGGRRAAMAGLFLLAVLLLLASSEAFAESLIAAGSQFGINEFLLIQWTAPLASESAELLPVALFAWRLRASEAMGTLISSKVNQWTLLVGLIPVAFAFSSGGFGGFPVTPAQREEILLTAAQSAFAVVLLANLRLNVKESVALLVLFLVQLITSIVLPEGMGIRTVERVGLSVVYLALAVGLAVRSWRTLRDTAVDGTVTSVATLSAEDEETGESEGGGRGQPAGSAAVGTARSTPTVTGARDGRG